MGVEALIAGMVRMMRVDRRWRRAREGETTCSEMQAMDFVYARFVHPYTWSLDRSMMFQKGEFMVWGRTWGVKLSHTQYQCEAVFRRCRKSPFHESSSASISSSDSAPLLTPFSPFAAATPSSFSFSSSSEEELSSALSGITTLFKYVTWFGIMLVGWDPGRTDV